MSDETPVWVQVMEAGFGALLESKGLRRVSPRCYRLDGDGLYWESLLFRGPTAEPNSICDVTGYRVQGLNEIHRQVTGLSCDNALGGRQFTEYYGIGDAYKSVKNKIAIDHQRRNIISRIIDNIFTARSPSLSRKLPFYTQKYLEQSVWLTNKSSIEEISQNICKYWSEYLYPEYFVYRSVQELAKHLVQHIQPAAGWKFNPAAAIINSKGGCNDWVQRHLSYVSSLADLPEEEIERTLFSEHDGKYLFRRTGQEFSLRRKAAAIQRSHELLKRQSTQANILEKILF